MSGLAELLAARGHRVSGCDQRASRLTESLSAKGIQVEIGHDPNHLGQVDMVVYTAAIPRQQPELQEARARNLPTIERAVLLGAVAFAYPIRVAVAGTHGKTTTTGMLGVILTGAGLDPAISLGGELDQIGGNVRVGGSNLFLTEACEYVESFLHLAPTIAVILNVEPDHPDFFRDLDHLKGAFARFAALVPENGHVVARTELPNVAEAVRAAKANVVSFGQADADFRASEISFDRAGLPSFVPVAYGQPLGRFRLNVPGMHNIQNALAALAASTLLGVDPEVAKDALGQYRKGDRAYREDRTISD